MKKGRIREYDLRYLFPSETVTRQWSSHSVLELTLRSIGVGKPEEPAKFEAPSR